MSAPMARRRCVTSAGDTPIAVAASSEMHAAGYGWTTLPAAHAVENPSARQLLVAPCQNSKRVENRSAASGYDTPWRNHPSCPPGGRQARQKKCVEFTPSPGRRRAAPMDSGERSAVMRSTMAGHRSHTSSPWMARYSIGMSGEANIVRVPG